MAKSLPPLTWFRAFEATARHLSFTLAAQEIGMTQSAVSQHVKSLELRLGVPLFVRKPRSLLLTDDGRKLMPQVTSALETLAAAARTFEAGPTTNTLTVASSISVEQWIISPRLAQFSALFPDTKLRFIGTIWPDHFQSIQADVEIPFGSRTQFGKDATLLEPNDLIAVKAPKLRGPLLTLPLIEAVGTSAGWASWPNQSGQTLLPRIFVDSFGAALNIALHGNGVALVNRVLAQSALDSGQLVQADEGSLPIAEGYFVRVRSKEPAAVGFAKWLLDNRG